MTTSRSKKSYASLENILFAVAVMLSCAFGKYWLAAYFSSLALLEKLDLIRRAIEKAGSSDVA